MSISYSVIFDMDGVIFDSEKACLICWSEVAAKYGISEIDKVFTRCIGTNKNQTREIVETAYAKKFGAGIADRLLAESSRVFHEKYDGGRLPVKPGVKEILEYLKADHIRTAVASSTRKATVEKELEEAGFLGYFDMIIGGDAVKISKPNPEIYLLACEELSVRPEETFAIEDSYNGIRAAHGAGMRPIMVPDMIPADAEMRRLSEVVCGNLSEVREYLAKIGYKM